MKIYVGETSYAGKGIFAFLPIKSDELIFIIEGEIINEEYDDNCFGKGHWVGIGNRTWIKTCGNNPIYYTNHSCEPNALIKNKVELVALRDINPNEEITFDYSQTEEDPYFKMECACNNKNCRKIIFGNANWDKQELMENLVEYVRKKLGCK